MILVRNSCRAIALLEWTLFTFDSSLLRFLLKRLPGFESMRSQRIGDWPTFVFLATLQVFRCLVYSILIHYLLGDCALQNRLGEGVLVAVVPHEDSTRAPTATGLLSLCTILPNVDHLPL